jgi:hypothetical protein
MIIKTNEFELEIFQGTDVYFGSRKTGQIFKKWDDIDDNTKVGLAKIMEHVKGLGKDSEDLLFTIVNA